MIIWGSGGGSADLGEAEVRHCETCEKERPFKILLSYRYAHVYWLRWVTSKSYHLACDICRRGWEIESSLVESKLAKNPIPFMTRNGWMFLAGIAVLFAVFVMTI